ncbi:hypothetical protein BH18ACI2_BH18ACI2_13890 [soil metagenome]
MKSFEFRVSSFELDTKLFFNPKSDSKLETGFYS